MPDLLDRTLREHSPDSRNRCQECRSADGQAAQWPCLTFQLADRAQRYERS